MDKGDIAFQKMAMSRGSTEQPATRGIKVAQKRISCEKQKINMLQYD